MADKVEAEFSFDIPNFDDSGYRKIQMQLQQNYAETERERQIRFELILKVFKIPPPYKKVKVYLKNGLGIHEGSLSLVEQPEWPYNTRTPLFSNLKVTCCLSATPQPRLFSF